MEGAEGDRVGPDRPVGGLVSPQKLSRAVLPAASRIHPPGGLLYLLSARDGTMNGKVYVKRMGVPEDPQELSISATYAVHDDCTVDQAFVLELLPPGASIKYRGVLFDQGKQAYNVPMGNLLR